VQQNAVISLDERKKDLTWRLVNKTTRARYNVKQKQKQMAVRELSEVGAVEQRCLQLPPERQ